MAKAALENDDRDNNRSNEQKSNFTRAAHFFCTFLCRCFAWLQRETSRNFLVTLNGGNGVCVLTSSLFFTAPHVHLTFACWLPAFLILSPPLKNFHVVLQKKKFLSVALDLCRPFSRWPSLACHLISLALYSKFVDMTVNLSLIL